MTQSPSNQDFGGGWGQRLCKELVEVARPEGMHWAGCLCQWCTHPWALPFLPSDTANRAGRAWFLTQWKPSNGQRSHDTGSGAYGINNLLQFTTQGKFFSWSLIYNQSPRHWLLFPRRMTQIQPKIFLLLLSQMPIASSCSLQVIKKEIS